MTDKILIILGSARKESDTRFYVDFVFQNIDHEIIDLLDLRISPYSYEDKYRGNDDFLKTIDEMLKYDIIVFATPVYWYSMSGKMKILFDRLTDIVTTKKDIGRKLTNKIISLVAVGTDKELPEGFEIPFISTSLYFNLTYSSSIYFSTKHILSNKEQNELRIKHINQLKKSTYH